MRFWSRSILTSLLMLAQLGGQNLNRSDRLADIRVHSDLVLINTLVTDRYGKAVTGLPASSFRLFEDGKEQVVKYCISEDAPASIGFVIDTSGSMGGNIGLLKQAVTYFVWAANPADEYFLVEFQSRPHLVIPFTTEADRLVREVGRVQAGGSTALFDAVQLAVREMKNATRARRVLLIVSDGMDNHSRGTERATKRLTSETDFAIYGVDVWQPQYVDRYTIQRRDPESLESISAPTGGRTFTVRDPKKLPAVAEMISLEIRHEYVLAYVPPNHTTDGKFHRVRVNLGTGESLRISNRAGYYAPVK